MREATRLPRVVFVLVLLVSLAVLFAPGSDVPTHVPISDKVVHGTLFAALALTGSWARLPRWVLGPALVAYAVISEILQAVLPIGRDGDVLDALADGVGVVVGLGLAYAVRRVTTSGWASRWGAGSGSGSRPSSP